MHRFEDLRSAAIAAITLSFLATGLAPAARSASYITFDVSGAVATDALCINNNGDVAGVWSDSQGVNHGFVRTANGTITPFDPSGSTQTWPVAINSNGDVAGWFDTSDGYSHAFVRSHTGTITVINAPGQNPWTSVGGLNDHGEITGSYFASGVPPAAYSFIPGQKFFAFSPANATGTFPSGVNDSRTVTGAYTTSADNAWHGFSMSGGTVTTFDVPNSVGSRFGTEPDAINASGVIVGASGIANPTGHEPQVESFILTNGSFTTFHILGLRTVAKSINSSGVITGYCDKAPTIKAHGFVRETTGRTTEFLVTHAISTAPYAINDSGVIAGGFEDQNNAGHAFLRMP